MLNSTPNHRRQPFRPPLVSIVAAGTSLSSSPTATLCTGPIERAKDLGSSIIGHGACTATQPGDQVLLGVLDSSTSSPAVEPASNATALQSSTSSALPFKVGTNPCRKYMTYPFATDHQAAADLTVIALLGLTLYISRDTGQLLKQLQTSALTTN